MIKRSLFPLSSRIKCDVLDLIFKSISGTCWSFLLHDCKLISLPAIKPSRLRMWDMELCVYQISAILKSHHTLLTTLAKTLTPPGPIFDMVIWCLHRNTTLLSFVSNNFMLNLATSCTIARYNSVRVSSIPKYLWSFSSRANQNLHRSQPFSPNKHFGPNS